MKKVAIWVWLVGTAAFAASFAVPWLAVLTVLAMVAIGAILVVQYRRDRTAGRTPGGKQV